MEQFFASLTKRQTMLLLTALAFGGSEAVEAFAHLTKEEEELLRYRAQALLQIPRDKRVPLLVQEIKRLVTQRRRQLGSADPKRLATLLAAERGAVVTVILQALPSELADAVRAQLSDRPEVKLQREVKPDILSIVRWKLEDGLRQSSPQVGVFRFTDLLTLQQRELLAICDRMGARVLATAVAGLPDAEREEFLGKLPPDQKNLALRAAEAGKARRLSEDDARTVLTMYGALESPPQGVRTAGAQRLVRACVAQGAEFAQRLVERHAGDLGKLFARWLKEERNKPVKGDGGRMDIVEQMERLSQKGVIDKPMRLPPPMRPPPGGLAPPPRPKTSQSVARAVPSSAPSTAPSRPAVPRASGAQQPGPRRDAIAERNARRAGASAAPKGLDPKADAHQSQRVLRDGKPLSKEAPAAGPQPKAPRRAVTSPALQEMPKRKDRSAPPTGARSPVLKGQRGPSGGSG